MFHYPDKPVLGLAKHLLVEADVGVAGGQHLDRVAKIYGDPAARQVSASVFVRSMMLVT